MDLGEIRKRRQHDEFVGREEQLAFFQSNFSWDLDDNRRRFVINIFGQGGVGKTWLLRRFISLASECGAVTAYTDETEDNVLGVMGCISEQFETQGYALKGFAERYLAYRQRRREIEADPDVRSALPRRVGRAVTRGSLDLARGVPGVGGAFVELVPHDYIVEKGGDFAAAVARKLRNKEDVHLVLEPLETLTPLFVEDLRSVAENRVVTLFFDTYERTAGFLDTWLRDLLDDQYGKMPANILLGIGGQIELPRSDWLAYEGLLARFSIEPFTEKEAREYLARKSIVDYQVAEVILGLSGRVPLLMAMLATRSPSDPAEVGDPSGDAVQRFLRWVDSQMQRRLAIDAALPLRVNQDVIAVLAGAEQADALFSWLKSMPFVEKRGDCWNYHHMVRSHMLRYKRQESPQGWHDLHDKLAEFYEGLCSGLELDDDACRKDETWQTYALEALYHRLCRAPQAQVAAALGGFLAAWKSERSFARRWAQVIERAGEDADVAEVKQWGTQLIDGSKAYEEGNYGAAAVLFSALLEQSGLDSHWQAEARGWRGYLYYLLDRLSESLVDLTEAIELAPEEGEYWINRGLTHADLDRYGDALADLNKAIELDPRNERALASRGEVSRQMAFYGDALADLNKAIELDPDYEWALGMRGVTYIQMNRYEEGLADFSKAIKLDPEHEWAISQRGNAYELLGHHKEALADFSRAIELDPDNFSVIARRGDVYKAMDCQEDALADYDRAIELDPDYDWALTGRGDIYYEMGRYEDALADLSKAIELDADHILAITQRGETYLAMGFFEEALADTNRAIDLDPDNDWALAIRGETYMSKGRYQEALADLNRAIELDPDDDWAFATRGETYVRMRRFAEALADFNRAVELDPEKDWYYYDRAIMHLAEHHTEQAQADLNNAIDYSRQRYEERPDDWGNAFNLGLYYLARGDTEKALHHYQYVLSCEPSRYSFHEALRDLEVFLTLFSDHSGSQDAQRLLTEHLEGTET